MTSKTQALPGSAGSDIKRVPTDAEVRQAIRSAAAELAMGLDRSRPLRREELERCGRDILERLELPCAFLGFAMVSVSNEFWRSAFEAVPFRRRLLLLPHCLRDQVACTGTYDSIGLHCGGCENCDIYGLKGEAEQLGYSVIVAEGTSSVLLKVLEDGADGILGVACLDSLEKSFQRVVELGIPHVAVPLLRDGCRDTEIEISQIRALLTAGTSSSPALVATPSPRSYIRLLRETTRLFQPPTLAELLQPYIDTNESAESAAAHPASMQAIALQWLTEGGKRLRPFVTLASYAIAKHGIAVLDCGDDLPERLPLSIRRVAVAIEALHKASLVHDDIEDDDAYRYGRPTLHRVHGVAQAINVGDFLIGLGYRLIAGETASLGAECVADILDRLSHAHLQLCRGQGAELENQQRPQPPDRPADVMQIAAQKTAPAFEAAVYAGLRVANTAVDPGTLRRFSAYIGEGFQIRNDLDDWREDNHNKQQRGLDVRAGRVTLLSTFAAKSGHAPLLRQLTEAIEQSPSDELLDQIYDVYRRSGALAKVEQLYQKLRDRALATADEFPTADLQELMRFLARMILPQSGELQ